MQYIPPLKYTNNSPAHKIINPTGVIAKFDRYYKVWQVLRSAKIITKGDRTGGAPLIWSEVLNPNDVIVFYLYLIKIRSRAILGF